MPCPVVHTRASGERQKAEFSQPGEDSGKKDYIRWNAPGVEVKQKDEDEYIRKVAEQFNTLQLKNFNEHMHCYRGTHLKTQGCVAGKFIVHDNLPAHLKQGMFKTPGTYDCIMRYSSLLPKLAADNVALPRGIGIKIFGIEGEKIWGEDKKTQDWTFNNYPILELRTPKDTCEIADSLIRNFDDIPTFAKEMGERPDAEVATVPVKLPKQHMYAMPEYSQSAYRHGDFVAKYGVFPLGEDQRKREEGHDVKDDDAVNVLATEARDFHLVNKVTYAFCAQMLQNLDEQSVDDIGVEWDPVKYPFEQIATLEFPPQDSYLPEFRTWWDDRITVNSWHGLKEHQPLGSTNRMRRVVYAESRKLRMQVNGFKDYIEPGSINEVPVPIAPPLSAFKV